MSPRPRTQLMALPVIYRNDADRLCPEHGADDQIPFALPDIVGTT